MPSARRASSYQALGCGCLSRKALTSTGHATKDCIMSVGDVFPLIKAPDAWPVPVVATVAMVCLAGLDLVGALFAKEWAENGSIRALVLGAGAFLVLFWVYASSL